MASGSAQFDEILQAPEPEEPELPIELTGPQYVKTLAGASAPFPYFDPLQISSKVCFRLRPPSLQRRFLLFTRCLGRIVLILHVSRLLLHVRSARRPVRGGHVPGYGV